MKIDGFSLRDMLMAKTARTWGDVASREHAVHKTLCERFGEPENQHTIRLPPGALETRDMTASGVSGSNYLVGTSQGEYLPSLQPFAAPIALGAQTFNVGRDNVAIPVGGTAATAYWLAGENAAQTETQPVIGSTAATSKTVAAFAHITHQALKQSNAEQVIRTELARAAGSAVTTAILQGTGTLGQPLGIIFTPNVGSFTGTSMTQAHLRSAQTSISTAILNRAAVGMTTTAAVAETLATRQRFTGSDRAIWEGASHDGTVEGIRAMTSSGCPSATAIVGDWSQAWLLEWAGGMQIQVDPFTYFTSGLVQVRLLLLFDILFPRPAAFSIATSVS